MSQVTPQLEFFERAVTERNIPLALEHAQQLLNAIDEGYGRLHRVAWSMPNHMNEAETLTSFATRFCAAFGELMAAPGTQLTPVEFESLMTHHRWIDVLFAISGFGGSEHMPHRIAGHDGPPWNFNGATLPKFLLTFRPGGQVDLDPEAILTAHPAMGAMTFFHYLSTRYCIEPRATEMREKLLAILPGRLNSVLFGKLTLDRICEPYMHCSYAHLPGKHAIKRDLIEQMRRVLLAEGAPEWAGDAPILVNGKPVIVIITEHFWEHHAVYRMLAPAIVALKEKFHLVGFVRESHRTAKVEACFDETITYPGLPSIQGALATAHEILKRKPAMVFHLGVGMTSHTIMLASLRLAPVQACSYGHTATTMSPAIDIMIMPEDFAIHPEVWSEKLLLVPKAAMPIAPRDAEKVDVSTAMYVRPDDGKVQIAVSASIMKLNSRLLDALQRIEREAKSKVRFLFFVGAGMGLTRLYAERQIKHWLSDAVIFPEVDYSQYMAAMETCDFFLCPFPYGNMNSIVDAVKLSLPGVCLDGAEAHAHADAALFRRVGLPDELIASNVDDYVATAVRLADDAHWRASHHATVKGNDVEAILYEGDTRLFCEAVAAHLAAQGLMPVAEPA